MSFAPGQNVIAPLPFNCICGTIESVDSDGRLTLTNAFDFFGPVGRRARIDASTAQPFDEAPRMLGLVDMSNLQMCATA